MTSLTVGRDIGQLYPTMNQMILTSTMMIMMKIIISKRWIKCLIIPARLKAKRKKLAKVSVQIIS